MATMAGAPQAAAIRERFWVISAMLMATVMVAGFSLQAAMGRSSFGAPLYIHVHALIFFGFVLLYLVQNVLAGTGSLALHRRLGWLALGWVPAMVAMGTYTVVQMVRQGRVPFFFQPAYFLVMDPVTVLTFAGLALTAIGMRRDTMWHRRLMFCAMTSVLAPGLGRLLPAPLFMPYVEETVLAVALLFPLAGVIRDLRTEGRIHPAWWWGIGTIAAMQIAINLPAFGGFGAWLYPLVTAGSAGAGVAPFAFAPFPPH